MSEIDIEGIRQNPALAALYGLRPSRRRTTFHSDSDDDNAGSDNESDAVISDAADEEDDDTYRSSGAGSRNTSNKASKRNDASRGLSGFGSRRGKQPGQRSVKQRRGSFYDDETEESASESESEEANSVDEDSDYERPTVHYTEEPDDRPQIETVLNARPILSTGDHYDNPKESFEFLVKWASQSHLHNSWERWVDLRALKGAKRVDNFIKTLILDHELRMDPLASAEDIESMDIERTRQLDTLEDFKQPERIIVSERHEALQYLVKWRRLGYDSCTWEDAERIAEISPELAEKYQHRQNSRILPQHSVSYAANHRPKFMKLNAQPDYIGDGTDTYKLRDFQLTGINWMAFLWSRNENGILADEMGLGKTVQTVAFLSWLIYSRKQNGPHLVVVPLSTITSWQETFDSWAPDINYVAYMGNGSARETIRKHEFWVNADAVVKKPKFNVLITTYEYILKEREVLGNIKWQFMAVDEAHRLKNSKSALYDSLSSFKVANKLLITGTPLQNNLRELAALIDFLMPGAGLIDHEKIEDFDAHTGQDQEEYIRELHNQLKPYILRRLKKDVEKSLPSKTERILRVDLSDLQTAYYTNIISRNYAALNQGASSANQMKLLNVMAELKKASNHPYLFPVAEQQFFRSIGREESSASREETLKGLIMNSGKMVLLDKLLGRLRKDGHRVLIFSQMVRMLDILADYLQLRGLQFQRLDGTISSDKRKVAIDHFNSPDSPDFVFLLSTRAGGLGINLMTADTVIIFDSDWNPQADLQAMARAHRIGQKKHVMIYRFVAKDTVEEQVLERARKKMILEYAVISLGTTTSEKPGDSGDPPSTSELSEILKFGAASMFQASNNQKKLEALNLDDVLDHAEDHDTTPDLGDMQSHLGGEEFLKQFEVTDYKADMTWDEIIPAEELKQIKEEEKKRRDAEFLQKQIEMSQKRKTRATPDWKMEDDQEGDGENATKEKDKGPKTLTEKEIRSLYRAILRFGDLETQWKKLFQDGNLPTRRPEAVKKSWAEMVAAAEHAIEKENAKRFEEAQQEAQEKGGTDALVATLFKKKKSKATLFDFRGVRNLNADLMLQRPAEMRTLHENVPLSNPSWRLEQKVKPVNDWSIPWTIIEDSHLLAGARKYGYGAWTLMRDDPTLKLNGKMFLDAKDEERFFKHNKPQISGDATSKDAAVSKPHSQDSKQAPIAPKQTSPPTSEQVDVEKLDSAKEASKVDSKLKKKSPNPGSIHLARRLDYLIYVLRGENEETKSSASSGDASHSNGNTELDSSKRKASSRAASPPGVKLAKKPRLEGKKEKKVRKKEPKVEPTKAPSQDNLTEPTKSPADLADENEYASMDEDECYHHMQSIVPVLQRIRKGRPPSWDRREYSSALKKDLLIVGDYIVAEVKKESAGSRERLGNHLWSYVRNSWPAKNKVTSASLRLMYEKKKGLRDTPQSKS